MPNLLPKEVMANLQKQIEDNSQGGPTEFGRSFKFDFDKGEFVFSPSGSIVETNGAETLKEWIRKSLITARNRFLIYNHEFGCDLEERIGQSLPKEILYSEIERTIKEAIIYDDRVKSADNFSMAFIRDKLYVTFLVTANTGEQIPIAEEV